MFAEHRYLEPPKKLMEAAVSAGRSRTEARKKIKVLHQPVGEKIKFCSPIKFHRKHKKASNTLLKKKDKNCVLLLPLKHI